MSRKQPRTSCRSASAPASAARGCAIRTTSTERVNRDSSWRTASRSHRLTRLRATAFPTFRLTVRPIREESDARRGIQSTRRDGRRTLCPRPCTLRKSDDFRRRQERGKVNPFRVTSDDCIASTDTPPPTSRQNRKMERRRGSGGLRPNGRDKTLTALRAAALQDVAAPGGGHTGTEAVRALPLDVAWLVRPLHRDLPKGLPPPTCWEAADFRGSRWPDGGWAWGPNNRADSG